MGTRWGGRLKRLLAQDFSWPETRGRDLGVGVTRTVVWLLPLAVVGCYCPDWRWLWRAEELHA